MKYVAGIQHNEKTVTRLTMVQYHTYNAKTKNIIIIISFASIFASAMMGFDSVAGIALLMVGCFMFTSIDYPARSMAKKICDEQKDHMPWAKYEAAEDGFWVTSGGGTWKVEYKDFFSILEDNEYIYMFVNKLSGYMIPKASIQDGTVEGFKNFICEKSGLDMEKPGRKFKLSRKTGIDIIKEKLQKDKEDPNMSEAKAARKAAEAEAKAAAKEKASGKSRLKDYEDRMAAKNKTVTRYVEEEEESADLDEAEDIEETAEAEAALPEEE